MPYLVISTSYQSGKFGKETIIGGDRMDSTIRNKLGAERKPEYKSSCGYWYEVGKPAREVVDLLEKYDYRIHSTCQNATDIFWNMHKAQTKES